MGQIIKAVLLSLIVGQFIWLSGCSESLPESYQPLPTPISLESFKLYDQNAANITQDDLKDKWSLVFFGFTYCPDVCPTTLAELNNAARQIELDNLQVVLVSVDPERDTPKQLKDYIEYFNPKFQAWSGELPQLESLARQMHIFFQKQKMEDTYTMDHSSQVVLVNPKGEYQGFFTAPLNVDDMAGYLNSL